MPVSKKPRKKMRSKKKAPSNVVDFPPNPREMEETTSSSTVETQISFDRRQMERSMANMFGLRKNDPIDQAQELMYDAWECSEPEQRIALAKDALKISPLCADAYNLLAEENAKTLDEMLALYRLATEAGKKAIGPDGFEEYAEKFWVFLDTRPYMRARAGLGGALWASGDKEGAIENFKGMLELNPADNQGIRFTLVEKLLDMGRLDELKILLEMHADEYIANIQYTRALIAFSEGADSAKDLAKKAWRVNKHVPAMLSGKKRQVKTGSYITLGGENEASKYVEDFGRAWKRTPGAINWLSKVTASL